LITGITDQAEAYAEYGIMLSSWVDTLVADAIVVAVVYQSFCLCVTIAAIAKRESLFDKRQIQHDASSLDSMSFLVWRL
jgi:hypothetical protein